MSSKNNNNNDDGIRKFFDKARLPDFVSFDYKSSDDGRRDGHDIPTYVKLFSRFDPQQQVGRRNFIDFRRACILDYYHVHDYLTCDQFDRNIILKSKRYDPVVHAIISFMLSWDIDSLTEFGNVFPRFVPFVATLLQQDRKYIYECRQEENGLRVPYVLTSFKLIRSAFVDDDDNEKDGERAIASVQTLQLLNYIDRQFVTHLRQVYHLFRTESATMEDLNMLEKDSPIPYDITDLIGNYSDLKRNAKLKFITGQACAGKTTLLNSLKRYGWKVLSRGDIGSFSGKINNPVAVACLHASVEWAQQHTDVLGDRSSIDNLLWVWIMQYCNPKYEESLVDELLRFVNVNFNAPSLAYFIGQKAAIFVDPFPSICEKRMLVRGTGGDAYRGRLRGYAITQAIAYYAIARLFGWKVFCVPYDESRNFDTSRYANIADYLIHHYFGMPDSTTNPIPQSRYDKPQNVYVPDFEFAKSVGIFK